VWVVQINLEGEMGVILELENLVGNHITVACEKAATLAKKANKTVHFEFNGTHVTAHPGESSEVLMSRWNADYEASAKAWRESPQYKEQEERRKADAKAAGNRG
jgi:heme-degrading monooxygenase HmoA